MSAFLRLAVMVDRDMNHAGDAAVLCLVGDLFPQSRYASQRHIEIGVVGGVDMDIHQHAQERMRPIEPGMRGRVRREEIRGILFITTTPIF